MTTEWKDTTLYRHGERGLADPREWTLSGNLVRITVHHYLGRDDAWFVFCRQAGIDMLRLDGQTIEEAKSQAVEIVKNKLRSMADDAETLAS